MKLNTGPKGCIVIGICLLSFKGMVLCTFTSSGKFLFFANMKGIDIGRYGDGVHCAI